VRFALAAGLALLAAGCGTASSPAARHPAPRPRTLPGISAAPRAPSVVPQRRELARLLALDRPVFCGGPRGRLVALTFDDGPGPYTGLALKELSRARARATFFLVGKSIRRFPAWPRREKADGALGDHTATHPDLAALSRAAMVHELAAGQAAARRAAGVAIRLFRPPYGLSTPAIAAEARRLGMVEVLWSVDSGDSIGGNFHQIAARVRRGIRPGSIVLMHENRGQTIRALRSILPYLRRHRLRPVSVPELLAADPPTFALLRAGAGGCG